MQIARFEQPRYFLCFTGCESADRLPFSLRSAKLTVLIQNEPLHRASGAKAATFAQTKFSIEIAARRMANIYETILRRKAVL